MCWALSGRQLFEDQPRQTDGLSLLSGGRIGRFRRHGPSDPVFALRWRQIGESVPDMPPLRRRLTQAAGLYRRYQPVRSGEQPAGPVFLLARNWRERVHGEQRQVTSEPATGAGGQRASNLGRVASAGGKCFQTAGRQPIARLDRARDGDSRQVDDDAASRHYVGTAEPAPCNADSSSTDTIQPRQPSAPHPQGIAASAGQA